MTYKQTHGETIKDAFKEFHQTNPDVYSEFKKLAFEAIEAGRKKISSKMIINVIRWNVMIKTTCYTGFKINDAFTPYYARKFMKDFPTYWGIFNTRTIRAK